MDPRRLRLLLALSRLGSMRAVADSFNMTTSTVSQQIAALARETRTQLIEPEGRRVRLTPAGRRLAEHAVTILAALDAAQLDLDPDAEPAGILRVGGFATGIRVSLLPVLAELATTHPRVEVIVSEYEPIEAFRLLADDELDLALTYDYNLVPASPDTVLDAIALWTTQWGWRFRRRTRRREAFRLRRPPLDRELPQQRRRGGRPSSGVPGRLQPAHRPSDRQPRSRRGPDPGRLRRGSAPRRPPGP